MSESRWLSWKPPQSFEKAPEEDLQNQHNPSAANSVGFVGPSPAQIQNAEMTSPVRETVPTLIVEESNVDSLALRVLTSDGVPIVGTEADAASLGRPRHSVYTVDEALRVLSLKDPQSVAELHHFKVACGGVFNEDPTRLQ